MSIKEDKPATVTFEYFDSTSLFLRAKREERREEVVDITENTDTKRRKSSRKSSKKTECPNCLSYVLPRDLDKHMKYECEARLIRCRFYPQCQCQPFPANEREEHRKFCRIAAKRRKILKHKKGPLPCPRCGSTERPHLECPKEKVSCPHCSEKVLRCELNTQHHLKTCSILVKRDELARLYKVHAIETTTCPMCGNKEILLKDLHRHQREECPMRLVSCPKCNEAVAFQNLSSHLSTRCTAIKRRDELAETRRVRLENPTCKLCGESVSSMLALKEHMKDTCRKRKIPCPNYPCTRVLYPHDLNFHLLRGRRDPCFLCKKLVLDRPYIFRTKDQVLSVDIIPSLGVVPENTVKELSNLSELLGKHAKLRKRIIRTFRRDYQTIYELDDVKNILSDLNFREMEDEDWSRLIEKIERVTEKMEICDRVRRVCFMNLVHVHYELHIQAGGRGDVVTKVLFVCGDCVEIKKKLAPLTKTDDYDRLPVCQIAFKRQFLLHQRKINDELVDCPEGCDEKVKQRHLSRHLENECVKRKVTCRREGCNARVRFCDLENHERSTECQVYYRGDTMAVKARGRMEITDCALGCGYSGKTVDVRRHERERCRRRMIVCPHEGCEVWVPFEDIPAHSMICQAVPAKRNRDMDKRSWTRNLQTHPDLIDYWKQKVRLRETRVGRHLGDEALDVLRGEMDGVCLTDSSTKQV
eukprot:g675.t1